MTYPRIYSTDEERIQARRERHRARYAAMSPEERRAFARRKNARKSKPKLVTIIEPSRRLEAPLPPPQPRLETVDEYLARGGRIDRLPVAWA